jgi:hypothetical protein
VGCGPITYTYNGGSCSGTDGSNPPDCLTGAWNNPNYTDTYANVPLGTGGSLACWTVELGIVGVSAVVCTDTCVESGGLACKSCLAGIGIINVVAGCGFSACLANCQDQGYGPSFGGPVSACY